MMFDGKDEKLGKDLREIWEDQRAFNLLFRPTPQTASEMAEQARDFVLFTESELHELLRTLPWKKHRRMPFRGNPSHMHEEGIDTLKYVLSLLQIIGIDSPEQLIDLYWQKTAVVRQRYREEWVEKLDGPCVVVDIDNVLCDYITGIGNWIVDHYPMHAAMARNVMRERLYFKAETMGLSEETWQEIKHHFRVRGGKRDLPVFPDAKPFLDMLRSQKRRIVLLTSRPIDEYPNILTDTLIWLDRNNLPFDFLWWGMDKAERVVKVPDLKSKIMYAVDDDRKFIDQFQKAGIPSFWLRRHGGPNGLALPDDIKEVRSLTEFDNEFHDRY